MGFYSKDQLCYDCAEVIRLFQKGGMKGYQCRRCKTIYYAPVSLCSTEFKVFNSMLRELDLNNEIICRTDKHGWSKCTEHYPILSNPCLFLLIS
jgi:hypothetical protein